MTKKIFYRAFGTNDYGNQPSQFLYETPSFEEAKAALEGYEYGWVDELTEEVVHTSKTEMVFEKEKEE